MAIRSSIFCLSCKTHKDVMHASGEFPSECGECKRSKADELRAVTLNALKDLPIEERLSRIEAWIYDYRAPVPLSEMRF